MTTAAGFVLAGGQSSRMGRDKALVHLAGKPLIEHALGILLNAGLPAAIAGGKPALAAFAPLVEDRHSAQGPLGGICAALAATHARFAVFLPVDLPLIPASHYIYLGDTARLPYGAKSQATIARYAVESARFLEERGAQMLVIA